MQNIYVIYTEKVTNGSLKLVGGTAPHNGRLEISYKGRYGTICDDGFESVDGKVACHQLGFAGLHSLNSTTHYEEGIGQIWLESLHCQPTDLFLANCTHIGWGNNDCHHGEDIALQCNGECYKGLAAWFIKTVYFTLRPRVRAFYMP